MCLADILHLDRILDRFHDLGRVRLVHNADLLSQAAGNAVVDRIAVHQYACVRRNLLHIIIDCIVRSDCDVILFQICCNLLIHNFFLQKPDALRVGKHQVGQDDRHVIDVSAADV